MKAIVGGDVYTPTRIIPDGIVLIDGERIVDVGTPRQVSIPHGTTQIDAKGQIVCPGFVDTHVHGGDGGDFTDGTVEAVRAAARRHLRAGTTSLVATTATAPIEQIWASFEAIQAVMRNPAHDEARILGIHMEGPYLAPAQRGSHAAELLYMPTAEERERLLSYTPDLIRVTLAPEREGALELIRILAQRGILVCGGHSDAVYEQVCQAMRAGLKHITHLWSGMSTVRRIGPKRYSGMLEAGLVEDGLSAEIIADGYHLPTSLMRLAFRMKGPERLCLISDAMRASGLGPGRYEIGGMEAIVEPGYEVAVVADRTCFAGSISTIQQCLREIVQVVGVSLVDGLRMATLTPARIQGVADRLGELAPGKLADVLILDRARLEPLWVMRGGQVVLHPDPES